MKQSAKQTLKAAAISFCLAGPGSLLSAMYWPTPAHAADTAETPAAPGQTTGQAAHKDSGLTLYGDRDNGAASSDLTLTDLRDAGLALNQVRQQALNIFMEATRKPCDGASKSEMTFASTIAEKDIETNGKSCPYIAPRAQWLLYYVGTVEPIITLLSQDVHDTKSGVAKMMVPEDTRHKLLPLWHQWSDGIEGINTELTGVNDLIGDGKTDNLSLAKHALAMFKHTETLERARQQAFAIIRNSEKRNAEVNKVNLP